jgi:hypothetical protein
MDGHKRCKLADFGTAIVKEKMGTELVGTGNALLIIQKLMCSCIYVT